MTGPSRRAPAPGSAAATAAILAFVVAYMANGYLTLEPASRNVPLLAGGVTVLLLLVELVHLGLVRRRPEPRVRPGGPASAARFGREWRVLSSVAAAVAGVYLFGFLITVPAYVCVAIAVIGRRRWRVAALVAVVTTAAIYGAFELLLSYRLFPGVLFS